MLNTMPVLMPQLNNNQIPYAQSLRTVQASKKSIQV